MTTYRSDDGGDAFVIISRNKDAPETGSLTTSQPPLNTVIDFTAFVAKKKEYQEAVREAAGELESMSCTCVGMALALRDLGLMTAAPVGTVVFDPERELASCTDPRVRKILELSTILHAAGESFAAETDD